MSFQVPRLVVLFAVFAWLVLAGCTSDLKLTKGRSDAGGQVDAGPDAGAFELASSEPANGASDVEPPRAVVFAFNTDVFSGVGQITLLEAFDEVVVERVDVDDPSVSFDGRRLRVEWQTALTLDTEYTVVIEPGAVVDAAGARYGGLAVGDYSFTTRAPEPLLIEQSVPQDGASDVAVSTPIRLSFSREIMAGAVGQIQLLQADDQVVVQADTVAQSQRVSIAGDELTLELEARLKYATEYVVTLDEEAVRGLDGARFAVADARVIRFTTRAPPTLVLGGTHPPTGAMLVDPAVNLVATFSEPVELGTGAIVVREASDNSIFESVDVASDAVTVTDVWITVDLDGVLAGQTSYYVNISPGAVRSLRGADFAGISDDTSFRFTTAAMSPPELMLVGSTPQPGATGVPVDLDLVFGFSETVTKGSGSVNLHRASDGTVLESISIDDPRVEVTATTVTIDPMALLDGNSSYYVTVTPGAFVSDLGASFAGITTPAGLGFTTVSTFGLVGLAPTNGAESVALDSDLVLTFSEDVELGSGSVTIFDEDADAVFASLAVDGAGFDVTGAVVTITPSSAFAEGVTYSVVVEPGAIGERGGVEFSGLSRGEWSFQSYARCDEGEQLVSGSCTLATAGAVTWQTARAACRARGEGWDLATIDSSAQQQALNQLLQQWVPGQELWFGASDLAVEGEWRWVDGDQFWRGDPGGSAVGGAYVNWRGSEPTGGEQSCGRLIPEDSNWEWADADCDNEYGFVCQGPTN